MEKEFKKPKKSSNILSEIGLIVAGLVLIVAGFILLIYNLPAILLIIHLIPLILGLGMLVMGAYLLGIGIQTIRVKSELKSPLEIKYRGGELKWQNLRKEK